MKGLHLFAAACVTIALAGATWAAIRPAPADAPVAAVPGLRQVFQAGFEAPVTLEVAPDGKRARLSGTDEDGARWNDLDHVFEMVAPYAFGRLVTTRFSDAQVYAGARALFMRQDVAANGSQNRLQFFSDDATFKGEIYTRRHYFVPAGNLASLSAEDDAVSIAGTREIRGGSAPPGAANADFSMPLYLVRRGDALVFALAILDYSNGTRWSDWTRPPFGLLTYGAETKAPLDRWFTLDIYVRRDPVHGAIKIWLDGTEIFDLENVRTKNDTDKWFTKLADIDAEPAPFELFVDNVEIWTR